MKIAILGSLYLTMSYQDWKMLLQRNYDSCEEDQFLITGRNSLLATYVKSYASEYGIPVKVYEIDETLDIRKARLNRNLALIDDSDFVLVFSPSTFIKYVDWDGASGPLVSGKKALILKTTNQIEMSNRIHRESTNRKVPVSPDELLSIEEEIALVKQIQQSPEDCEAAKAKLLLANRRFVRSVAKRMLKKCEPTSHTLDELIAEGNEGLLAAAQRYDETRGFKFISYAVWFIRTSIQNYLEED